MELEALQGVKTNGRGAFLSCLHLTRCASMALPFSLRNALRTLHCHIEEQKDGNLLACSLAWFIQSLTVDHIHKSHHLGAIHGYGLLLSGITGGCEVGRRTWFIAQLRSAVPLAVFFWGAASTWAIAEHVGR